MKPATAEHTNTSKIMLVIMKHKLNHNRITMNGS